jgi:S-ribosylhomocysteine lyase
LRNSEFADSVVYWGPMGCLTGFYFLTNTSHEIRPREIAGLIRKAFRFMAEYEGEVPGATALNCGNYLLHDLPIAKWEAGEFLSRKWSFTYPKTKRVSAGGKTFFDA